MDAEAEEALPTASERDTDSRIVITKRFEGLPDLFRNLLLKEFQP